MASEVDGLVDSTVLEQQQHDDLEVSLVSGAENRNSARKRKRNPQSSTRPNKRRKLQQTHSEMNQIDQMDDDLGVGNENGHQILSVADNEDSDDCSSGEEYIPRTAINNVRPKRRKSAVRVQCLNCTNKLRVEHAAAVDGPIFCDGPIDEGQSTCNHQFKHLSTVHHCRDCNFHLCPSCYLHRMGGDMSTYQRIYAQYKSGWQAFFQSLSSQSSCSSSQNGPDSSSDLEISPPECKAKDADHHSQGQKADEPREQISRDGLKKRSTKMIEDEKYILCELLLDAGNRDHI